MEKVTLAEVLIKPITGEWGIEASDNQGVPVIRTADFQNDGTINYSSLVVRNINKEKIEKKHLNYGDIIIEKSGGSDTKPVGRVVLFTKKDGIFLVNNFTAILRVKNKNQLYFKYLFYYLSYFYKKYGTVRYENKTTGIHNLKLEAMLKKEMIYLPAYKTQYNIVQVLEKIRKCIHIYCQQLELLDKLTKSRFVEMFGDPIKNSKKWPMKKLSEIAGLITNGNTPKGGSENYVEEGIIFLRSQNIWRNRIDLTDVAYIDEDTHKHMSKSSVHYKDILITKTGRINTENSSLGRAALYLGKNNSANINGHVYLIRLDTKVVLPEFVTIILTSESYRQYIRRVCVGGIDKRQINLEQVEDFPIILPSLILQKRFTDFINYIDKSRQIIQASLDETQKLFDSLMQQYFG